jgi:methylmalonyl-CoA mutase cobalamin-binding domain/chain
MSGETPGNWVGALAGALASGAASAEDEQQKIVCSPEDRCMDRPLRIVLAKVGLDGHDRGIKVVARALRDAGMHVIYAGLWQTPEAVARVVADEDADWLGLSLLSGAHMTLVPRVLEALRAAGVGDVGVLVGGIIPEADVPRLRAMGVAHVFGPGTSLDAIVAFLNQERQP